VPSLPGIRTVLLGVLLGTAALLRPEAAAARSPYLVTPDPAVAELTPAYRYANMSDAEALAELDRRKILHLRVSDAPGVRAPVRLTGRLHGVYFHSSLSPDERVSSPYEILDARLALALDDFAAVLERHDIDEVLHYTMYRPGGGGHAAHEPAAEPSGTDRVRSGKAPARAGKKLDRKSAVEPKSPKRPGKPGAKQKDPKRRREPVAARRPARAPAPLDRGGAGTPGTRHPAGLAIDVGGLRKKDGRWISVGTHFQGQIGEKTCGQGARSPESPEARELRSLVCEASDLGVFTYVLTPNYDAAHVDHFHMEIKPGVRWFLYH
jgi:hypothetical protein